MKTFILAASVMAAGVVMAQVPVPVPVIGQQAVTCDVTFTLSGVDCSVPKVQAVGKDPITGVWGWRTANPTDIAVDCWYDAATDKRKVSATAADIGGWRFGMTNEWVAGKHQYPGKAFRLTDPTDIVDVLIEVDFGTDWPE